MELAIESGSGGSGSAPETIRGTVLVPGPPTSREVRLVEVGSQAAVESRPVNDTIPPDGPVEDAVAAVLVRGQQGAEERQRARTVVGADAGYGLANECSPCHEAIYAGWAKEPHARALEALRTEKKADDVTCLSCHSDYYRRTKLVPAAGMKAEGVECASCHGDALLYGLTGRGELVAKAVSEGSCLECHTAERSPGFNYETYRRRLAH